MNEASTPYPRCLQTSAAAMAARPVAVAASGQRYRMVWLCLTRLDSSAAYAELRSPWGRSEAYADLADQADDGPVTAPLPPVPGEAPPIPPWQPLLALTQVPARIRSGRPLRLAIRGLIASVLALIVLQLVPGTPAAPADILGLTIWFVLTGRKDLAPPPER